MGKLVIYYVFDIMGFGYVEQAADDRACGADLFLSFEVGYDLVCVCVLFVEVGFEVVCEGGELRAKGFLLFEVFYNIGEGYG